MSTTSTVTPVPARPGPTSKDRRFAAFSALLVVVMLGVFVRGRGDLTATFALNDARGGAVVLPDLVLDVGTSVGILAALVAVLALFQFLRGFGDRATAVGGVSALLFVVALLVWSAADGNLSLIAILRGTLFAAVPISLGALSGVLCERSGVINIAIEGQFLAGAFAAAVVGSVLASAWWGLAGGIAAGMLIGLLLALLTIRYEADQIVSGVVLIVLATGLTSFLTSQVLADRPEWNGPERFAPIEVPWLSEIPILGPVLFRQTVMVYAMLLSVAVLQFALFRTRWGLRLRSVGEHPRAADTVGISVLGTRYRAVMLGGLFAGIGGSWFTLEAASQFSKEMTGGRGFIALAAMLVGRYSPVGGFAAALLFGFADATATTMQRLAVPIPSTLLRATPYVLTLLVVAGLIGRLRVPAADGEPYTKE